jgi:hypothetical protein
MFPRRVRSHALKSAIHEGRDRNGNIVLHQKLTPDIAVRQATGYASGRGDYKNDSLLAGIESAKGFFD